MKVVVDFSWSFRFQESWRVNWDWKAGPGLITQTSQRRKWAPVPTRVVKSQFEVASRSCRGVEVGLAKGTQVDTVLCRLRSRCLTWRTGVQGGWVSGYI